MSDTPWVDEIVVQLNVAMQQFRLQGDRLRQFKCTPENVVFMKAYKHVEDITATLEECRLLDSSVGVCQCGRPDEEIIRDVRELCRRPPGYWTLVIAKQPKQDEE